MCYLHVCVLRALEAKCPCFVRDGDAREALEDGLEAHAHEADRAARLCGGGGRVSTRRTYRAAGAGLRTLEEKPTEESPNTSRGLKPRPSCATMRPRPLPPCWP